MGIRINPTHSNYSMVVKHVFPFIFLLFSHSVFGQNEKQEKMELLNFMVGEWIGFI